VNYNKLKSEIEDAPMTYLPALLMTVVNAAKAKKVFMDDAAMLRFVKNVQNGSKETEDLVEP